MGRPKKIVEIAPIQLPAVIEPEERAVQVIGVDAQSLIQSAIEHSASLDMLERLLDLNDRVIKQAAEKSYREAMSAFQSECPVITKKRSVKNKDKSERYKYAPIEDIISVAGPIMAKHGFSYRFTTEQTSESVKVVCHIHHAGGHTEQSAFTIPIVKSEFMTAQQSVGASLSFAKRYTLENGFGIIRGGEDTDGNDPEAEKKKAESDARAKAAADKLAALPEDVKKGFDVLGYTARVQWQFCEDHKWELDRILADIKKIVARQEGQ